jgi:hypothetical protein
MLRIALTGLLSVAGGGMTPEAKPSDELTRLVRRLGSDDFHERQAAGETILARWFELQSELESWPSPVDEETRARLDILRTHVRRRHHTDLLTELLEMRTTAATSELPMWEELSAVIGDDRPARLLYRRMLLAEPELIRLLDRNDAELGRALQTRLQALVDLGPFRNTLQMDEAEPASVAVLMLISLAGGEQAHPQLSGVLQSRINFGLSDGSELAREGLHEPLQRLLGAWVAAPHAAPRELRLEKGRQYGLPQTVIPARETLQDETNTIVDRKDAILMLARFGKESEISALLPLLRDREVVETTRRGGRSPDETRIQDLALVALLRIAGLDPAQFGFTALRADAATVYSPQSAGFASEDSRQAAFRQWRDWLLLHRDSLTIAGMDAIEGITL